MPEFTTESGLIVHDRRFSRADDTDEERALWPDDSARFGFGSEHVMYPRPGMMPASRWWTPPNGNGVPPPPVMPWAGWPIDWATPNWNDDMVGGLADIMGRVSLVFGCIDLNSSILSTMPPYRVVNEDVVDDLPWMRNPQPEVYTGWTEAMRQLVMSYWTGEAFVWATSRYEDGHVRRWIVLNPGWVEVEMDGQMRRYWLGKRDDGAPEITDDILHIRYMSWPGVPNGIGPLEALGNTMFGVEAMESYQSMLAQRGGIPWGVLASKTNLTEPQAEELKWRFVNARLNSMGAPAVLSGDVTLTPFNLSPKDMALLELRQFDEGRISTLLGVPPTLMGLPSGDGSMTYRNAESIYDFHWRAYLRPKSSTIMEALSQWALPNLQRVELNRDEYVRPALLDRARAYEILFKIEDPDTGDRVLTIEEIRDAERFATRDDDAELEPSIDLLLKLGVPKELIWERLGIDVERARQLSEDERMAESRATAASFATPFDQFRGPAPTSLAPPP